MEKDKALKQTWKTAHKTANKTNLRNVLAVLFIVTIIASIPMTYNVNSVSATPSDTTSQKPEWTLNFGGAGHDYARCVIQASDGGYVMAGYTNSFGAGGDDFLVVKTDSAGNVVWNKTYGGTGYDEAFWIVQTSDGGYAIAGSTNSFGAGGNDHFWLVKIDSLGNKLWDKTYGGETGYAFARCVVQTSDGGYAIVGDKNSPYDEDSVFWLVKTDSEGNAVWNKTYVGFQDNYAWSIVQTSDGGYVMAGYIGSFDAGIYFDWLIKIDSIGNVVWDKTYGGAGNDYAYCVVQTTDGGYALAGQKLVNSGSGTYDFWLVKTDSLGNKLWDKTYDGNGYDFAYCVVQTSDGGYAIAGSTNSGEHFWLVKTDSLGNKLWDKTLGENSIDAAYCVVQTSDGGYAMAGYIRSNDSENTNAYLVKISASIYSLAEITVISGGTGYSTPHVLLVGGGGTGATAIARISQGVIIGMVLTNPGVGYTSAPSIIIRDPSPRAKGATATIDFAFS